MGPALIEWYLTGRCFLNCLHCLNSSGANERTPKGNLLDLAEKIVETKPSTLNLSGGDPLIEPSLFELMCFFAKRDVILTLSTSGWRFDHDIARKVVQYCAGGIQFSLDGGEASTHDFIRGRQGAFAKVIEAIKILREISTNYNIEVNFTINSLNYLEIEKAVRLAQSIKVNSFKLSTLYPLGRLLQHQQLFLSDDKLVLVLKKISSLRDEKMIKIVYRNPLWTLRTTIGEIVENKLMAILEDGKVVITPYLPFCFGNIYTDNLRKIWDEKMKNFFATEIFQSHIEDIEKYLYAGEVIWI